MNDLAIVIIAGGSARRLNGADKPLIVLRGKPVISHITERLAPQAGTLALNIPQARQSQYQGFASAFNDLIFDTTDSPKGPVGGIMIAMKWANTIGATGLLTWPGDTPYPPTDLIRRLAPLANNGAAVPHDGTRLQPLCALWPVIDPERLRAARSVHGALDITGSVSCDFSDQPACFTNINTQDDVAALTKKAPPA